MDFGFIEEIGSSFLVGAIALLLFEGLLYFATGWTMTGFFRLPLGIDPPRDETPAQPRVVNHDAPPGEIRTGVFLALAIVVGLSISAIAQRPVEEAARPLRAASVPVFKLVDDFGENALWKMDGATSLRELRLRVLKSETSDDHLSRLGRELMAHRVPSRYCDSSGNMPRSPESDAAEATLMLEERCGLKLFYTAKNWAFMQPTLFQELSSSEARVHLFGSIALVCVLLLPVASMFMGVGLYMALGRIIGSLMLLVGIAGTAILLMFLFLPSGEIDWHSSGFAVAVGTAICLAGVLGLVTLVHRRLPATQRPLARTVALRVTALVVIILMSHLVSYLAYSREQDELGRRVFGYFSSAHVVSAPLAGPQGASSSGRP